MNEYKIFLQSEDGDTKYDLEKDFEGLKYHECKGLFAKGSRENHYEESYADSDELRVWQGDNIARKATNITLSLYFIGDNRKTAYEGFYNAIKQGKWYFWDTVRLKKTFFVFNDEYNTSDEIYKGSTPYFAASFKLQNLWGACKDCDINGNEV